MSSEKQPKKFLMVQKSMTVSASDSWLKLNWGESGVFRTAYSRELLARLIAPVREKTLPAADRLGIIRDLFALAEAGVIPTTDALAFLAAYKNEDEFTVWTEIASGIGQLRQILAKENMKEDLDKIVIWLFSPIYKKLGWNKKKNESDSDALLRSLVLSALGRAGHKLIVAEARKKFALVRTGKRVDADIRSAIYSICASKGGMKEFRNFTTLYRKHPLQEEKDRIRDTIGNFADPKILRLVCEFALSEHVRPQDAFFMLAYVGRNLHGRDAWFAFIKKNWKLLVTRYGGGHYMGSIVKAISGSAEKKHLAEFKKFFSTHDAPGAARAIEQVIERMESNIAWRERDGKKIKEFLKK